MTARAWIDAGIAYLKRDQQGDYSPEDMMPPREAEARQEYADVNDEIANLYEIINAAEAIGERAPSHRYSQLGALFAERNTLDDEIAEFDRINDNGGMEP